MNRLLWQIVYKIQSHLRYLSLLTCVRLDWTLPSDSPVRSQDADQNRSQFSLTDRESGRTEGLHRIIQNLRERNTPTEESPSSLYHHTPEYDPEQGYLVCSSCGKHHTAHRSY